MRRVLLVSYYFPPLGGIAALRALAFAQHLPEFGWEPIVLAPSNGAYFRDPTLRPPSCRMIRTRSLELSRMAKRVLGGGGDDARPAQVGSVGALARAAARRWLYFPDSQIGWYTSAAAAGRRLVSEGVDAIFSSSPPITGHLVARALHRRSGAPWIAEFRDPWAALMSERSRRAERLERSIAREASAVVMTSPSWAAQHAERWGRTVLVITNGFGSMPPRSSPGDELVACYLGSYNPDRQDLSSVWPAIARMAADRSSLPVRLRVVGEPSALMRAELRVGGVEALLEVTGFVPHTEALRHVASASVLLAAGPARPEGPIGQGWIPAKLFEYLATGLPILWVGVTPNDGAALLAGYPGCRILAPDQVDGVIATLREDAGKHYERDLAGLTRRDCARALADLLDAEARPDIGIVHAGPRRR